MIKRFLKFVFNKKVPEIGKIYESIYEAERQDPWKIRSVRQVEVEDVKGDWVKLSSHFTCEDIPMKLETFWRTFREKK